MCVYIYIYIWNRFIDNMFVDKLRSLAPGGAYTILYYTILYYTILYYTILYYIITYYNVL